jgi:predicted O-methyltransferase YrrM
MMTKTNLAARIKNSFNYRVRGIKSVPAQISIWEKRRYELQKQIEAGGEFQYFEMLREHVVACGLRANQHKVLPFLSYALAVRPRRIVELGASFSYYPETYANGSPWLASTAEDEGVLSTRVFLVACRILNQIGISATLTSVDIRDTHRFTNVQKLLTDCDLIRYWKPVMGQDSIAWLKAQTEPIDLCLVDSQHTYAQVKGELEALIPLMNPKGLIIVDDWADTEFKPHVEWSPDDDEEGVSKGGEFGAVLEFLKAHPEWRVEWWPSRVVSTVFLFGPQLGPLEI